MREGGAVEDGQGWAPGGGEGLAEAKPIAKIGDGSLAVEQRRYRCRGKQPGGERVLAERGTGAAEQFVEAPRAEEVEVGGVETVRDVGAGWARVEGRPAIFNAGQGVFVGSKDATRCGEVVEDPAMGARGDDKGKKGQERPITRRKKQDQEGNSKGKAHVAETDVLALEGLLPELEIGQATAICLGRRFVINDVYILHRRGPWRSGRSVSPNSIATRVRGYRIREELVCSVCRKVSTRIQPPP